MKHSKPQDFIHYGEIEAKVEKVVQGLKSKEQNGGLLTVSIENMPQIIQSNGVEYAKELAGELISRVALFIKTKDIVMQNNRGDINIVLQNYSHHELRIKVSELHQFLQHYGTTTSHLPVELLYTIGVVELPSDVTNAFDAMNRSYIALNEAKDQVQHFMFYDNSPEHLAESKNQMAFSGYIHHALMPTAVYLKPYFQKKMP